MTDDEKLAQLLLRKKKIIAARDDLISFAEYINPDSNDPDNVLKSAYTAKRHHRVIAAALEQVEKGLIQRLIINVPPRHGKTALASHTFIPWYMGKNPQNHMIAATYNDKFSWDFGRKVRETIRDPLFKHVFPELQIKTGAAAVDRVELESEGRAFFVGRGGTVTGRGGHLLVIDDPIKDRAEADSKTLREKLWTWYTQVMSSRLMTKAGSQILIQCMTGDTDVLMSSGVEKPLRDIRPGDMVATYRDGRLSASKVVNWVNNGPDCVFTIKTSSGITLKANERHPFLVFENGQAKWIRLRDLRRGHEIFRVSGASGKTRLALTKAAARPSKLRDIATRTTTRSVGLTAFARLLSMPSLAAKRISSTATKLTSLAMSRCLSSRAAFAPCANNPPATMFALTGVASSASITATTQGKSEGFSATIATLLSATHRQRKSPQQQPTISDFTLETVVEISPAEAEEVFDIQVAETENFIANGCVSHNTRWHEDDLVGRLTDPANPYYNEREAAKWHLVDLPALAEDNDVLGRKPGEALWPERFDVPYLEAAKRTDPRGFMALYQGRPAPEDGIFFRAEMLQEYHSPTARPKDEELRFYAASDHAVSIAQERDRSCLMPFGVDKNDDIWIMPDTVWARIPTDRAVEQMCNLIRKYKPLFWFAEKGHISKSIGPFLRKRMVETKSYCAIDEITPIGDKQSRAQSVLGRMSTGKIFFPAFAPWWPEVRSEILKFPAASHDDFVDTLSMMGLGLLKQLRPRGRPQDEPVIKFGTGAWLHDMRKREKRKADLAASRAGW